MKVIEYSVRDLPQEKEVYVPSCFQAWDTVDFILLLYKFEYVEALSLRPFMLDFY